MPLFDQISSRMRIAVCGLWAAGLLGTVVFTAAVLGLADSRSGGVEALYVCLHVLAGSVCLLRAALIARERLVWGVVGIGMMSWAGGYGYFFVALQNLDSAPYPSFADALWIAYLLACLAAIVLLIRSRLQSARATLWLDATVGSLALGAVTAAVLIGPILQSAGGDLMKVVWVIYPGIELLIIDAVLGVFALSGWRPGRVWLIIAGAFVIQVSGDMFYVYQAANGTYVTGGLLDVTWPLAALLLALAAWTEPAPVHGVQLQARQAVMATSAFALVAIGLLTYDHLYSINGPAFVLAALTIVVAFARSTITFNDMLTLALDKDVMVKDQERLETSMLAAQEGARRDPLTGLLNHREFHEAVREAADRAVRDKTNFSVVLFDVDGFKGVNDDYGHAEGDRLLRRLATMLSHSARSDDLVCRVGGDEFAILLSGADASVADTVARRVRASTDALQAGVGMSYGIGDWASDGPVVATMLLRADVALYAAKAARHTGPDSTGRSRSRRMVDGPRSDDELLRAILAAAREHLDVDVVFLSEFADGQQFFRTLDGDADSFGLQQDAGAPLEKSYCQRMVADRLPNLITDAKADLRVSHLASTHDADIGTYLGVPLQLGDGSLYGTLCCLSHTGDASLGVRDVAYMRLLARLIADHLDDRARDTKRERVHTGEAAISALLGALAARDSYTGNHSLDVVDLARKVAHQLRLSAEQTAVVEQVALLHDLGKIGIPDAILQKPGKLTPAEWQVMHQHPAIGAQIIASISSLSHLATAVRAEHERYDGHGYPDGLSADTIPLESRIVFACDAYHAMVSDRPYRAAMTDNDAQTELQTHAGRQFDPDVTDALLRVLQRLDHAAQILTTPARD